MNHIDLWVALLDTEHDPDQTLTDLTAGLDTPATREAKRIIQRETAIRRQCRGEYGRPGVPCEQRRRSDDNTCRHYLGWS